MNCSYFFGNDLSKQKSITKVNNLICCDSGLKWKLELTVSFSFRFLPVESEFFPTACSQGMILLLGIYSL